MIKKSNILSYVYVFPSVGNPRRGYIKAGNLLIPCALGRSGLTHSKREGDGGTPVSEYRAVRGWYRADRRRRPTTHIPLAPIQSHDGWCDEPGHRLYNRPIKHPFSARHEKMHREDHLYDIVLDLNWNNRPRIQGYGSAIFLHLALENFGPTEGCIALPASKIERFLKAIGPRTRIIVRSPPKSTRHRLSTHAL